MIRILTFVITALALLAGCGVGDGGRQFLKVQKGSFRSAFTETGELQAVRYSTLSMPVYPWEYGQVKILWLEKEGARVKAGDVVAQVDTVDVARKVGQKMADLAIARADLRELGAKQQKEMGGLEAQRHSAQAKLDLARVDTQRVRFESETRRQISALNLRKAEYALRKAEGKIESVRRVQAEDLLIQKAKISRLASEISRARDAIGRFTLRAPNGGLVEYLKREGKKAAIGDQMWPGFPILGLPDFSRMKVLTTVGEADVEKVHPGRRVSVRMDAFPKVAFEGEVTFVSLVSRIKEPNSRVKVFNVEVLLDLLDRADPVLRPGMTVSCEFLVADLKEALLVDNACLQRDGGEYVVYVKRFLGLRRVPVAPGLRNAQVAVVAGDLHEGDQVAVASRPGER
jgi:multidrug efflux pump subunit AcrA (membrane-fusion protein)